MSAQKVIAVCAREFPGHQNDCNDFVKAVASAFFTTNPFTGLNADQIIAAVSSKWTSLGKDHGKAIAQAQGGKIVLAGMTAKELGDAHGHVAIVVGDPGALSGMVIVPICYAGSLNPTARVARQRVSATFGAANARNSLISYFATAAEIEPPDEAFAILFGVLTESRRLAGYDDGYDDDAVWPHPRTSARALAAATALDAAGRNVDVGKPDGDRVKALWALIDETVEDVDAGKPAAARENVKRFLLHVAWHEGAKIKARLQFNGGPGRSFYQFEAPRAFDACEYADRKGALAKLAGATDRTESDVRAGYKAISGTSWPSTNKTIESCLVGFDFFATYAIRYVLVKIPAPIPAGNDAHAVYWADHWKVSFPNGDRDAQIKRFKAAADAVDAFPV